MTNSRDVQLMHNISLIAENIKNITRDREKAYTEWLRADHARLLRKVTDHPPSRYVEDQVVEKKAKYDALAVHYDKRLEEGLAWIKAECEKRA